jgi:hypothetical protein
MSEAIISAHGPLGSASILAESNHPARLMSVRITRAIAAILGGCTSTNGYLSNVGAAVYLGKLRGGAVQAPCINLLPGRHAPADPVYNPQWEQTREIEIRAALDANDYLDDANVQALDDIELVDLTIWDVRRCLSLGRDTLSALGAELRYLSDQPGYREDGGTVVGASLTYSVTYTADPADPDQPY